MVQAPGLCAGAYTGYGAKAMAAVREYMDEKKWKEAEAQVPMVAKSLEDVAAGDWDDRRRSRRDCIA